jgi:oligoendopeptidase F
MSETTIATATATATATAKAELGALPEWDLGDLYPSTDSDALTADIEAGAGEAAAIAELYEGRLAELDGDDLAALIERYEALGETLGRIMSFAYLVYARDMNDPESGRFLQTMQERTNEISARILFVTLELNRIDDAVLEAQLASPKLAYYGPWIRDTRAYREHQLEDRIEKLLHEKSVAGRAAWIRLFDETLAGLRFPYRGEDLTNAQALDLLSSKDADARREISGVLADVLGSEIQTFALVTNTLAKDKEIEDRWRGFARPISERNLENLVEDDVVDALIAAVRDAYPRLAHRYYALKARWMGVEKLDFWDRNAPLPDDDDRTVSWDQARDTVLDAYAAFSPELAELGTRFFGNGWIDAEVRPGKSPGAFAHPTVPSAHPYLLLNYQGRTRDVMTLAHELGHGVHQILAGPRGALMADTPLTLAETASVFGEQLTFRAMLDNEQDPIRRRVMLANKIEDMLNTVIRQVAFCDFERTLHDRRREGELTPDEIGDLWMAVQGESLGPAIRLGDSYRNYWSYIPHFVHTPFYVYAYAFGDCLVNALYAVYQNAEAGFQDMYLDMLRAGGTLRHKELLAPFGLDASDPAFWSRGLGVIESFIDDLDAALDPAPS